MEGLDSHLDRVPDVKSQDRTAAINAEAHMNSLLRKPSAPETPPTTPTPTETENPWGEDDKTPVFGEEIISPTAVVVGGTTAEAEAAGWLSAIRRASNNELFPPDQRKQHVQEIVTAAAEKGILKPEQITTQLDSIGITGIQLQKPLEKL